MAQWGRSDPYTDHSKILCNPVTDEPILIWMVGHISSTWFLRNHEPDRQCSVTIVPISKTAGRCANQLICGFSQPQLPAADESLSLIRATRWQSSRQGEPATLFSSVYDAREVFCSKSEMLAYPATHLKKKDLVLLEARLIRYFLKDDKGRYSHFRAQFELHAISLLHSHDEVNSDHSDEQDVGDLRI